MWGGSDNEERKPSLVNWATVTSSKANGGLGIRSMQEANLAFLAKLGWRLTNEGNSLWAQVLGNKYLRGDRSVAGIKHRPNASTVWQGLEKACPVLSKGVRKRVGNGNDTLFWLDCWLMPFPLLNVALNDMSMIEQHNVVADYWKIGEGWDWGRP